MVALPLNRFSFQFKIFRENVANGVHIYWQVLDLLASVELNP